MKRTDYIQIDGMTQTKTKPGDLIMIDYKLPFQNDVGIGIIIKIESDTAYVISTFGARWEFIHNLYPIQNKE